MSIQVVTGDPSSNNITNYRLCDIIGYDPSGDSLYLTIVRQYKQVLGNANIGCLAFGCGLHRACFHPMSSLASVGGK